MQVKNAKKQPEKPPVSSKPGKISRQDPVTYISETGKVALCVMFLSFLLVSKCTSFTLNGISTAFLLCWVIFIREGWDHLWHFLWIKDQLQGNWLLEFFLSARTESCKLKLNLESHIKIVLGCFRTTFLM